MEGERRGNKQSKRGRVRKCKQYERSGRGKEGEQDRWESEGGKRTGAQGGREGQVSYGRGVRARYYTLR